LDLFLLSDFTCSEGLADENQNPEAITGLLLN